MCILSCLVCLVCMWDRVCAVEKAITDATDKWASQKYTELIVFGMLCAVKVLLGRVLITFSCTECCACFRSFLFFFLFFFGKRMVWGWNEKYYSACPSCHLVSSIRKRWQRNESNILQCRNGDFMRHEFCSHRQFSPSLPFLLLCQFILMEWPTIPLPRQSSP